MQNYVGQEYIHTLRMDFTVKKEIPDVEQDLTKFAYSLILFFFKEVEGDDDFSNILV